MLELSNGDIARARQHSLLLAGPSLGSAEAVATWFGAMQAQDPASAVWSLGVRLPGSVAADVDGAFERGGILRTWPMRGTIHVIPSRDAGWMLELTGVRALSGSATRLGQLGLDQNSVDRAVAALESALHGGHRLTRADSFAALQQAGLDTSGQRGYHLLWHAAHLGVVCIGPYQGKEQTFVLLREWAPVQDRLERRDAMAELAHRYFRSHGPVTVKDFAGWTGLTLTDARAAVAANDGRLESARFGPDECWMSTGLAEALRQGAGRDRLPAVTLPGFDEFLLGYKDRSVQLAAERMGDVVPGGNGMFRATVCIDGRVAGVWTRIVRRARVDVTVHPFAPFTKREEREVDQALAAYGGFLGLPVRRQGL